MNLLPLLAALLLTYLIGSIPFALLFVRWKTGLDVREVGSGNAGTTNVFRVAGWKIGVMVLLADFLKGFLPVFLFPLWLSSIDAGFESFLAPLLIGAVVLGHVFPLWASFRGGKGVACGAAALVASWPWAAPIGLLSFFVTLMVTRYVSVSSLVAAWVVALVYWFGFTENQNLVFGMFLFVLAMGITFLHRHNFQRLIHRKEPHFFTWKKKKSME
ncbi:MAG: glycerol-3-phosphate 1-O-acyltransferase PlsY [Spirochaetales bacterium]|nr:glycerol-3-phosphate 1-O-acyltransferase PlsY [Spirochaetales bacterium]